MFVSSSCTVNYYGILSLNIENVFVPVLFEININKRQVCCQFQKLQAIVSCVGLMTGSIQNSKHVDSFLIVITITPGRVVCPIRHVDCHRVNAHN
jgi:hypothetical protein